MWRKCDVRWKKGKIVKKWKVVGVSISKNEFKQIFKVEYNKFKEHAKKVKIQYEELRRLKENLPAGHVIVQMDFAENY